MRLVQMWGGCRIEAFSLSPGEKTGLIACLPQSMVPKMKKALCVKVKVVFKFKLLCLRAL